MNNISKLLFLLLALQHVAFAAVTAKVDSDNIELGEMVTYYLDISGDNITRPNIQRLCNTEVISTSSQTSMQVVNGDFKKSYILSYKFIPQNSCNIEQIGVDVNGKIELSNAVDVKIKPASQTKDQDFVLTIESNKKELFVGETFDLTLTFKQKTDSEAVDSEFIPPELKGLWLKNEAKPLRNKDGKYTVTKVVYTMAPQREGNLKIEKAQMRIASRSNKENNWGAWIPTIKWKTYFSNEVDIKVKPLPAGLSLVGDFSMKAIADRSEVNANEAVNVTIEVEGSGNLEDVKSFKPFIDGVTVFDEKIVLEGNKLTQKIAFIAEMDFTIPSFGLKYLSAQTKEEKTVYTKEINIKIKNAKAKEELVIKRDENRTATVQSSPSRGVDGLWLAVMFIVGFAAGTLLMILKPYKRWQKEKGVSIKDPKVLLMKLLPFRDDKEVRELVDTLEKSIYSDEKPKCDKKSLKEIVKKYKIS